MVQKRIIGYSILVLLVAGALFGIFNLRSEKEAEDQVLEPKLSSISAEYVTSTDEVVIRWDVENVEVSELNTGLRYATTSQSDAELTSETYPSFVFSKRVDSLYEARVDVSTLEDFFYRIQVAHNNEFLWSSEGEVLLTQDGELSE